MILAGVKGSGLANLHSFFCRAGIGDHSRVDGVGEDVADGVGVEGLGGRQAGATFGPEVDALSVGEAVELVVEAAGDVGEGEFACDVPVKHQFDGVGFDGVGDAEGLTAAVGAAGIGAVAGAVGIGAGGAVAFAVAEAIGGGQFAVDGVVEPAAAHLLSGGSSL